MASVNDSPSSKSKSPAAASGSGATGSGAASFRRNPSTPTMTTTSSIKKSFRYKDELSAEFDPSTYSAGQSLASILNNPLVGGTADSSWSNWFFAAADSSLDVPPPTPTRSLPEISKADFRSYVDSISEEYSRFVDVQKHSSKEAERGTYHNAGPTSDHGSTSGDHGTYHGGEGLAACLREIPSLYFEEDFALEKGSTFQAACPFSTIPQNMMLQERLSQYLDVVEVHLVREISARSESFFEAQRQLEDLNGKVLEACNQVAELKATIRLLEEDVVEPAEGIRSRSVQRDNLLALHDKLKLMSYVNQAVSDLRILVSGADCAGALDVIDELQQLLEGEELSGMHCFRHLADQLATSTEAVNSMLAADFTRVAIRNASDLEPSEIVSSLKTTADGLKAISTEVKIEEQEETDLREQLVPLVIGLLRTSKLPGVLKGYKDDLTNDLKAAIKTVVAESLPVLLARTGDGEATAAERQAELAGGPTLAHKLRSLTPEAFVQLLIAVFKVTQTRLVRAAAIKHIIEEIINGLQGSYAAAAIAAAFASGAAAVAAAEAAQEQKHQALPVLAQSVTDNDPLVPKGSRGAQLSNISKQFRADVLRENTEALWAACDAAHGRWGKLLAVRGPVHSKLRLQEFESIHNVTQEFIAATEKVGGRLGYTIRGTLQSQSKSFVDAQHASRVTKITLQLESETWVPADIPEEFQEMVERFQDNVVDTEQSNGEVETSNGRDNHSTKKSRVRTIRIHGTGYRMVNSGLILLKVLSEYVDMCIALPAVATEVVHRLAEILKVFNSASCQLVLGARAMKAANLKSITAKHLAMASQTITFLQLLIPEIKKSLFVYIPEARHGLVGSQLDIIAQDYRTHREEIHSKLVQIMKERLLAYLKLLPQVLENPDDDPTSGESEPAEKLANDAGILQKVLSPLLQEEDMRSIFTRVVAIFHSELSETFSKLNESTLSDKQKERVYVDANYILNCMRGLPSDPMNDGGDKPRELDAFLMRRLEREEGRVVVVPSP